MKTPTTKFLLTGSHGLVGTCLRQHYADLVQWVPLDLTQGVDILDLQAFERAAEKHGDALALIHLAAFTDVSAAHMQNGDRQGLCYRLNVLGTRHAAAVCQRLGIPLVHVSTDFVFDGQSPQPYTEDSQPHPIEWYGHTKLLAEEEAARAARHAIARIAFPYVDGTPARPDLVHKLADALRQGRTLTMVNDQVITPTFGGDIADGLVALGKNAAGGQLFHLVGSQPLTPYELALQMAQHLGCDPALVQPCTLASLQEKDPRPRQPTLRVDNTNWCAWAQAHGLARPLTFAQGLQRVLADLG